MKKLLNFIFLFCFIFLNNSYGNIDLYQFLPKFKESFFENQFIQIPYNTKILINPNIERKYKSSLNSLRNTISFLNKTGNFEIRIISLSNTEKLSFPNKLNAKPEGYLLEIKKNKIIITGNDYLGCLHGITTLEVLIQKNKGYLKKGYIFDYPDNNIRAIHIVLRNTLLKDLKKLIKKSRFGQFNTVIFQVADGVKLKSMEGLYKQNALTVEEFKKLVKFSRENGLEVIPELKLLTHQEKFLKNKYPDIMFNRVTYNPANPKTYQVVLPIVDEIIKLVEPKAFHIGHDEVAGHNEKSKRKWLKKGEKMLPPELFLKDVLILHSYLKKRGIETWMWGDMLISPKEFPSMFPKHLHGIDGYPEIRKKIPKDIVICDWHYNDTQEEFPSSLEFAKEGHKVLGSTWKKKITIKNFSKYIANMPFNGEGMIATIWFHVQRKEWDIVDKIIKISAEHYWNAKQN